MHISNCDLLLIFRSNHGPTLYHHLTDNGKILVETANFSEPTFI